MATVTFLLAVVANADVQYYGLYVAGVKVGFASVEEHPGTYQGKSAIWRQSRVHETLTAAGSTNDSDIETTSWSTLDNRPLAEKTTASSGKQSSDIDAAFGEKTVEVDADIGSNKVHRSIAIPSGLLVEDYTRLIHEKISRPGQEITCQVFFAGELGFERLNFKTIGPATFSTGGKTLSATLTEMRTEGQVVRIFTDGVGNLVREESPLGVVQQAETKDLALATPDRRIPGPDIVTLNALKADKPIGDALHLTELKLRFTGADLSGVPSDATQTISKAGEGWIVEVHPPLVNYIPVVSISRAALGKEAWTEPSDFLVSDDRKIVELAARLVAKNKRDVLGACDAIMDYVSKTMKPVAGIGLNRDARQILAQREGKCTDYAILTTTLMRAAGIPAKVACGLVVSDGSFYYHAWSEAWDGREWVGIDSVVDDPQFSACHIKLAAGNVKEGFGFGYLDPGKTKIEFLDAKYRSQ